MSFLFIPSNALAPESVYSLNQEYMVWPQHSRHPKDIQKFLIMSFLSRFCKLLPILLQQFICSLFLSQRKYHFNTFYHYPSPSLLSLIPKTIFLNLSVTEPLFLLSTSLAISRSSWFLSPGSSCMDFSRTAYLKSAGMNGLDQVIFYGCQVSWPFKKLALCPSCFLLEKGNLIAPLTSQTRKRDCLQQQCAIVVCNCCENPTFSFPTAQMEVVLAGRSMIEM